MAADIIVTINKAEWDALLARVKAAGKNIDKAIVRASNRVAAMALTRAKRVISKELGIKQSDLVTPHRFGALKSQSTGTALRVFKTNTSAQSAELRVSGRRIPVRFFRPRELAGKWIVKSGVRKKGVKAKRIYVRTTGVRYKIGSQGTKTARNAFMGRGQKGDSGSASIAASGHLGVFTRTDRTKKSSGTTPAMNFGRLGKRKRVGRLPIRELLGPSVPGAAEKNPEFRQMLNIDLSAEMLKRMTHEVDRIVGKGASGAV